MNGLSKYMSEDLILTAFKGKIASSTLFTKSFCIFRRPWVYSATFYDCWVSLANKKKQLIDTEGHFNGCIF